MGDFNEFRQLNDYKKSEHELKDIKTYFITDCRKKNTIQTVTIASHPLTMNYRRNEKFTEPIGCPRQVKSIAK